MGGGSGLLGVLIQTIKSKMTGLVTKFRLYTNWNFIKTKIITRIRDFFANLIGVKPRNKDDYYTVGKWMFSKRLLVAIVIIVGVVSIWYISTESTIFKKFSEDGITTYKYDSVRLRTAKGHVRITGKGGYLAYDGDVEKGYVTGVGTLYNKEGNVVYVGSFERNKYEGTGTRNYDNGNVMYKGTFHENLFDGSGYLYREDGSTEYNGDFSLGKKNGHGILYDTAENPIYEGAFSSDKIVYSEIIGKTVEEVSEAYKGHRTLYMTPTESVAIMDSIGALYHAYADEEALDSDETIDSVYVLSDCFSYSDDDLYSITDISDVFGDPIYEGNTNVILPEAVAINSLSETENVFSGKVKMDVDQTFSDVAEVNDYDRNYVVYIYSFRRGDLVYSFVCPNEGDSFEFYYITGAGNESA